MDRKTFESVYNTMLKFENLFEDGKPTFGIDFKEKVLELPHNTTICGVICNKEKHTMHVLYGNDVDNAVPVYAMGVSNWTGRKIIARIESVIADCEKQALDSQTCDSEDEAAWLNFLKVCHMISSGEILKFVPIAIKGIGLVNRLYYDKALNTTMIKTISNVAHSFYDVDEDSRKDILKIIVETYMIK